METNRSMWRSLVGRIKNFLRRKVILKTAFWVLKIIYEVAKLFDMFH